MPSTRVEVIQNPDGSLRQESQIELAKDNSQLGVTAGGNNSTMKEGGQIDEEKAKSDNTNRPKPNLAYG